MPMVLWVAAGGAIGAGARYLVNAGAIRLFGHGFPYGTLIVNVAGSFVMGLLIGWMALKWEGGPELRAFLATGILGGFTTFSAFSLDFITLYERKAHGAALIYAVGSVGLAIAAVFAGMWIMRKVVS